MNERAPTGRRAVGTRVDSGRSLGVLLSSGIETRQQPRHAFRSGIVDVARALGRCALAEEIRGPALARRGSPESRREGWACAGVSGNWETRGHPLGPKRLSRDVPMDIAAFCLKQNPLG